MASSVLLTVVAIGRNEGKSIARLGQSIGVFRGALEMPIETIFVDSASTDSSVEMAVREFDCVVVLEESKMLCAAAGRAVGTSLAKGEWILYLDGDMAIDRKIADQLPALLQTRDDSVVGYVGDYEYIFPDGTRRTISCTARDSKRAQTFGGASVLRRSAVVRAGNWDASLFAHEELDLCLRMVARGGRIIPIHAPMIQHWTEKLTKWQLVARAFLPSRGLGKKYFGIGQLVASRLRQRGMGALLWSQPYFALLLAGVVVASIFAVAKSVVSGWLIIAITLAVVAIARSPGWLLVYASWLFRIPFGLNKYLPGYNPTVRSIWRR